MSIELTLTALSNGPDAIGRHEGRAIFVPFTIPGETVRVEIVEEKPTFARARLLEVLSPSPDRVTPACKHFGTCGGCHFQHMSYEAQLKWKRQIVVDQLARIGGLESPNVLEAIPSPDPFHYRNHVQFSQTPDGRLGFIKSAKSVQSIDPISECHIARPEIMELFNRLEIEKLDVDRIGVRVGTEGETMLVFESETGEPPDVELDLPISVATVSKEGEAFAMIGGDHLIYEVLGRSFRVSPGSFFQVNTAQAETLVKLVLDALGLKGGETVLDLYSGVGLFSAFIAPAAARVISVESFAPAVRDAETNLDEFDNVELYESPVELALDHLVTLSPCHLVLLDPPRAGCDKQVIQHLLTLAAPRLVYVSCDPATLARDAKRLIAGGYRLASAQPLDMFPQTHHVETVAIFERPIL
ncbi:MAG: class I SAM-dependent RNA methyltransferase [Chloroflexi bacterium]|nr:class I SAM-dependent RNA methyltransferase [Chloroflexota bacterium]